MLRLSLCGLAKRTWYSGPSSKGTSRGPAVMPVVDITRKSGFVAGCNSANAVRIVRIASVQMVLSLSRFTIPMPEMIVSTTLSLGERTLRTAEAESTSPWVMVRWVDRVEGRTPLERRRVVSLEGVRATILRRVSEGRNKGEGELRAEQW